MHNSKLCSDCRNLLINQISPKHSRLIERSHIANYTIYRCDHCAAVLEQTETPCRWQLLPRPFIGSIQRF